MCCPPPPHRHTPHRTTAPHHHHHQQLGGLVFSQDRPRDYKFLIADADRDDNIRTPVVANINDEMRGLIPLTPEWTTWPDYDRWVMINRLVRIMWPKLTGAILDEVVNVARPILQDALAPVSVFEWFALCVCVFGSIVWGASFLLSVCPTHSLLHIHTHTHPPTHNAHAQIYK